MRKLALLLALLLLAGLTSALPVQAAPVLSELPTPLAAVADEEEGEAEESEDEEAEADEEEACEFEEEEFCEEEEAARKSKAKGKGGELGEECLLKNASAAVTANPGKRRLRLTIHYRTLKPATVNIEALLRSPKGTVYLGNDHARFRRSGVYRDTYELAEKQMKKAVTAREFEIELHAVNTPPSCKVELSAHRGGARKLSWS